MFGPCSPYADILDLCCLAPTGAFPDPCLEGGQPIPAGATDSALAAASELLWVATGRQFGVCEVKIRPCRQACSPCEIPFNEFGYGFGYWPALVDGMWYNVSCGCPGQCGCNALSEVPLPTPVIAVSEVKVDGVVLDPSEYRVDDFRVLVRLGGTWPRCQDLELEDTEPGTFSVTLTYGKEVPALLTRAAAALACEFLKSCVGAPCQLPQRISTLTRQGVTVGFIDAQEFWRDKRTGIYIVDLAIQTLNPDGLSRRPAIWSPDVSRWRRTNT